MMTLFYVLVLLHCLVQGALGQTTCPVNCGTGSIYDSASKLDPKCEKCWTGFHLAWSGTVS